MESGLYLGKAIDKLKKKIYDSRARWVYPERKLSDKLSDCR